MEFYFDFSQIAHGQIVKIDNSLLPVGYQKNDDKLRKIISDIVDNIGEASSVAQELKSPITSAEKLKSSDHIVYLMTERTPQGHFVVVGLIKMGWKKLYIYNKRGSRTEAMVFCLLDFYISETRQRRGYGIKLMDHMLKDNNIEARQLAVDQPSKQIMQFLSKHFNLSKLVNQSNNFVVFEEFFEKDYSNKNDSKNSVRSSGSKSQETFGRQIASKQRDSMVDIIYGKKTTDNRIDRNKFERRKK